MTDNATRAEDILTRMQFKQPIGIIDTIYIYLWVFAVTEYGVALEATMYTVALVAVFVALLSWLNLLWWGTVVLSFIVAFCIVISFKSIFSFILAIAIMFGTFGVVMMLWSGRYVGLI